MRIVLAALALAAVAPAIAQQMPTEAPGRPDLSQVTAGTYKADPGHTQVVFTLNHLGFSDYSGQFVEPNGTLVLDPHDSTATKVAISFPIAKVRTTVAALDEHLQKPEFFDAAKFPTGRFESTKIEFTGRRALIAGQLTLKGVTRPVVLSAEFVGAGANPMSKKMNVGFHATTQIKRSDFGISAGVPLVSDRVDLVINAAFEQQ